MQLPMNVDFHHVCIFAHFGHQHTHCRAEKPIAQVLCDKVQMAEEEFVLKAKEFVLGAKFEPKANQEMEIADFGLSKAKEALQSGPNPPSYIQLEAQWDICTSS